MRIKIPHEALGTFIRAAHTWLQRTVDAKSGLEVRFANQDGNLHVSAGADANYIEAVLKVEEGDLDALTQPIFLDVPSLAAYKFDTEGLTMIVPLGEKEDQRVTFSVPGFNFRIPRKKGEMWKRNHFDLKEEKINGLVLSKETFERLWKHMELPNSFRTDRVEFQICFDVDPGLGFICHAYDGMGAFCHTFKDEKIKGLQGRMAFIDSFFTPCKQFTVDNGIAFAMNGNQCLGEFRSESQGIEVLRWTQPKYQKPISEIPTTVSSKRQTLVTRILIDAKEMKSNLSKACMFLSQMETRAVPIEFSTVSEQYSLVTKNSEKGEVRVEGKLIEGSDVNLDINIQAACLKDYLGQFEDRVAVALEVLNKTVVLVQTLEEAELLYWMPVMPKTGAEG